MVCFENNSYVSFHSHFRFNHSFDSGWRKVLSKKDLTFQVTGNVGRRETVEDRAGSKCRKHINKIRDIGSFGNGV